MKGLVKPTVVLNAFTVENHNGDMQTYSVEDYMGNVEDFLKDYFEYEKLGMVVEVDISEDY